MIGSSTASMEGVVASMNSDRLDRGRRTARRPTSLVKATEESRVVFGETFEGLSAIARSVEDINEMARVIQEIASRTNLLAMNAAIEAAHAGESGKGFAVVADEIRKLASAASESSKQIGDTIRAVGEKMAKAADSRDRASASFKDMDAQIVRVTASASEDRRSPRGHRAKAGADHRLDARAARGLRAHGRGIGRHSRRRPSRWRAPWPRPLSVSQEVRANIGEIAAGLGRDILVFPGRLEPGGTARRSRTAIRLHDSTAESGRTRVSYANGSEGEEPQREGTEGSDRGRSHWLFAAGVRACSRSMLLINR